MASVITVHKAHKDPNDLQSETLGMTDRQNAFYACRSLIVILTPILCSVVLILPSFYHPKEESKDYFALHLSWVYVLLVFAIYNWTNSLAISITSYLPYIMYPLLGISNSRQLALTYMTSVNMLHFASLVLVLAVHVSGLRNKITLWILKTSSGSIRGIYICVFCITLVFAMMINSCFSTFLMVKVVDDLLEYMKLEVTNGTLGDERMAAVNEIVDVVEEIEEEQEAKEEEGKNKKPPAEEEKLDLPEVSLRESPNAIDVTTQRHPHLSPELEEIEPDQVDEDLIKDFVQRFDHENERLLKFYGGELLYAISVAANIGGIFLPSGSPVGEDFFTTKYLTCKECIFRWSLITWVLYALPLIIINASICLVFLFHLHFSKGGAWRKMRKFVGIDEQSLTLVEQSPVALQQLYKLFNHNYAQVKGFNFQESGTLFLICFFILLSLTRWPVSFPGWVQQVKPRKRLGAYIDIQDSCIMTLVILIMFMSPKTGLGIFKGPRGFCGKSREGNFIGWKNVQSKFPWSILILISATRSMGLFSNDSVAPIIAAGIARIATPSNSVAIRSVMMAFIGLLNLFLPNPGTTVVAQNVWNKLLSEQKMNAKFSPFIISIISVASLTFMIPTSSVPNAIVFRNRFEKNLEVSYFLKVGLPLFIFTFAMTFLYVLAWSHEGLTFV